MTIDPIKSLKQSPKTESELEPDNDSISITQKRLKNASSNNETKEALDHATGLFQSIINNKDTDKIIRKMPSDEYLQLLSLLDELISGSIDKRV